MAYSDSRHCTPIDGQGDKANDGSSHFGEENCSDYVDRLEERSKFRRQTFETTSLSVSGERVRPSPEDLILGGWPFGFLRRSVRGTVSTESLGHVCLRAPSPCCYPMRPRITKQSYWPRVSDRSMRYRLFKRITGTCLLVSGGRMASLRQGHGTTVGRRKSLTAAEKDHTLTDRVCAFKTNWAECRDQKRCRHRANGGDFSLDIHSYRTILRCAIWSFFSPTSTP